MTVTRTLSALFEKGTGEPSAKSHVELQESVTFETQFRRNQESLLRSRVNLILWMGVVLVPLFGGIDRILYPDHFSVFLAYRLVAAVFCLAFLIVNRLQNLGKKSFYLGAAAFYVVGLTIILMIIDLGGDSSIYYAGLNLVFVGFGVVLPIRPRRVLFHCAVLYLIYLNAVLWLSPSGVPEAFLANNMFIIATLAIVLFAVHVDYMHRQKEFQLRADLETLQGELQQYSEGLENLVEKKQRDLVDKVKEVQDRERLLLDTQKAAMFALAKLAESRDKDTGRHLERMSVLCVEIARELSQFPPYRGVIDPAFIEALAYSSALHDLGKVAIPDGVLLKKGTLTPEEYELVKQHAAIGGDALRAIDERLGGDSFFRMAQDIAYYHHERFDGQGYPEGLKGTEIPLAARIVTVADVFDALTSERCYHRASSAEEVVSILKRGCHTQFDPEVVEAFLRVHDRLRAMLAPPRKERRPFPK